MEEKQEKETEKRIMQEEKDIKMLPFMVGIGSCITAIVLSFMIKDNVTYLLYFSLFFMVASVISFFVVKSKWLPRVKSRLMILPIFLYTFGISLPLLLIEKGII